MSNVLVRIVCYWLASSVAAGLVAGIAKFQTYSGTGTFAQRFALFAIPVPMAIGVFHVPTLFIGAILCAWFGRPSAKWIPGILGIAFLIALAAHLVLRFATGEGYWGIFAFVTVDLGILAIIGGLAEPAKR